jgi:hypothetical protein
MTQAGIVARLVAVTALALTAVAIACRPRRGEQRARDHTLDFLPTDAWSLRQFCASSSRLCSSLPPITAIRIDMRFVRKLDASTIATLESLLAALSASGVRLLVHDCERDVERELRRRRFSVCTAALAANAPPLKRASATRR